MKYSVYLALFQALLLSSPAVSQASSDFVGLWWVSHGDGAPLQVRIYPDGTAWSDYPANNPGRWRMEEERLICLWADDWKEVFQQAGEGWVKLGFKPGVDVSAPPSNRSRAFRASEAPDGWYGVAP